MERYKSGHDSAATVGKDRKSQRLDGLNLVSSLGLIGQISNKEARRDQA